MSRRFGRRQKRAMRAEIAHQEARVRLREARLDEIGRELAEARAEIHRAKEILGNYCVAFAPETIAVSTTTQRWVQLARMSRPVYRLDEMGVPHAARLDAIDLPTLALVAEESGIDRRMHVRVRWADGSWGYAVDKETVESLPRSIAAEMLIEQISGAVALSIVEWVGGDE